MAPSPDPELVEQIRVMVRRDLKLGADEPLPLDAPFFGGEIDIDSLDILLLITSVERQFGVSISDAAKGKEAFGSLRTLVDYVQQHRGAVKSTEDGGGAPTQAVDWLSRLPHGPEFRFVSRVTEVSPGQQASAVWELSGAEPFFAGHFPGNPIVPGVLIAEALAQVSGLAAAAAPAGGPQGRLAHVDVRFERPAAPPVAIALSARVTREMGNLRACEVTARAGDHVLARGTIALYLGEG